MLPLAARIPFGLVASLVFVDFADELFSFLPAASIDGIRIDLDLSLAEAGALLAMLSAGGILGNFFTAAADFVSRRLLTSLGALAYGLSMIAFGAGQSFWVLAACAFVWGAASDAFVHGAQLALADLAGDDLEPMLARAVTALVLLVAPNVVVIGAAVVAYGVAGAIYWVTLQSSILRVRPGQSGTTMAVVNTLAITALAAPPIIGVIADRLWLGAGMALYALLAALGVAVALPVPGWLRRRA